MSYMCGSGNRQGPQATRSEASGAAQNSNAPVACISTINTRGAAPYFRNRHLSRVETFGISLSSLREPRRGRGDYPDERGGRISTDG